jgi:hypothetical protein
MANQDDHIAITHTQMKGNPNIVATPFPYCNNIVFAHHFLSDNSNTSS